MTKALRGRPRTFDRARALRQAMNVFWAAGYEGATLTDLQKAMGGITAPSFYAAFGSKEELFREAVELYSSTLGVPMMRAIDKGLANSRIGLVLVTPAMLGRLPKESVADKELSALLARNQLVPIVHKTTYEALRNVSPLLASRTGLDTAEDSMAVVAAKIAELVAI